MSHDTVETIRHKGSAIVARIVPDTDAESPADWDNVGAIAYLSRSRYCLGTEEVSEDRMREISEGIESGALVGLPVYAYVHGGATIRTGEAFDCQWDSGMSGYVYCTPEKAIDECGSIEQALKTLDGEVKTFDMYLRGDVYGYIVETDDGEHIDSCYGIFGFDYAREQATDALAYAVAQEANAAHDEFITDRLNANALAAHYDGM